MNNLDIDHSTARYLKDEFYNCDNIYTKVLGTIFRTFLEEMTVKYKNTKILRNNFEYTIYEIYCHSGVIIYRCQYDDIIIRLCRGEFNLVES